MKISQNDHAHRVQIIHKELAELYHSYLEWRYIDDGQIVPTIK